MNIGALDIVLDTSGAVPGWRFLPKAGPDVARCVIGRAPDEAMRLLPRVFNLCGAAHAMACAGALGLPLSDADLAERRRVSRDERLRDHAVAVLNDWPELFGEAPDRAALRQLGGDAADQKALRRHVLGEDMDLAQATPAMLDHWLRRGPSPVARLMRRIRETVRPDWGRVELRRPALPDIVEALECDGPCGARETTVADGWRETPLLSALLPREGASLFVRLLARLLDFVAGLDGTCDRQEGAGEIGGGRLPAGLGLARAARGMLAHRARIDRGVVTDYRVLSPSAWNLAPDGLLSRMLAALPLGTETPMLARIVVASVNPCVPVRLRFEAGEGFHA